MKSVAIFVWVMLSIFSIFNLWNLSVAKINSMTFTICDPVMKISSMKLAISRPVKLKNFFCENCCPWRNKILHPEWTHLHLFLKAFDQLSRTANNPLQMLLNLIIKQNYMSGLGEVKSPFSLTIKKHSCTKNSVRKFLELENFMWCNSKLFIVNWFWYWSFADISTGLWGNFLPSSFFMNEHFRQVGGSKLKSKTSNIPDTGYREGL